MPRIGSVAVFCGAQPGRDPRPLEAARALGRGLARGGRQLVYGGGRIGLMGALADATLAEGGAVVGVIPEFLTRREVAHQGVTRMVVTASMHARKQRMFELADAFVMLPGGLGTLDEIVEIITWRQLGLHDKPVLLCDIAGSAAPLASAVAGMIADGFAPEATRALFEVADGVAALLARLDALSAGAAAAHPARL